MGTHEDNTIEWQAPEGSPFRSLTITEAAELRAMAEATTLRFSGHRDPTDPRRLLDPDADAPWESLHPVAREVWERRGLKPEGA